MKQLSSSLKNYNFKGWTTEKIIEKYESVLASRENQIADLASEIGTVSDKFNSIQDQYSILHNEYLLLQNKFMKKEELLQQELKNKEILLMRLEKSENDYEELNRRYEKLVKIVNSMSEQRESNMNSGNFNNPLFKKNENSNDNLNNNNINVNINDDTYINEKKS